MFEWIKTFIAVYETKILVRRPNNLYFSKATVLQIKKLEQTLFRSSCSIT